MTRLATSTPTQVQGLPQASDNFPRRFRNKNPLIIRQIVAPSVLEQWSSSPGHVVQALNQTAAGAAEKRGQEQDVTAAGGADPLLPVMVAEDRRNFMDNPQFTRKIDMTARDIVARVLVGSGRQGDHGATRTSSELDADVVVPELVISEQQQDLWVSDVFAVPTISSSLTPSISAVTTMTTTVTGNTICPLCENQETFTTNDTVPQQQQDCRFYYRGMVPPSLYSALEIPTLLSSLSLPQETTAFANAPNKDLMRIWISLAGATTPLHYDRCHGILIQLVGRKRFVVFSHEDTHGLYPYDGISGPGHASKVRGLGHCFPLKFPSQSSKSPSSADGDDCHLLPHLDANMEEVQGRWPKIKNTTPWIVDLEPGDALYTPPGFWHEVTSIDHSVSITVPWDMDADELQSVPRHMAF
ncbi:hypothetical protein BGX29_010160 [Mortierella sp. GBA35]|nr:hypothetical protein BGX29_010160 [Mortierella sp. GBA35]